MNDLYLNVQYGNTLTAEVNITGISRLGGVQDAIKAKLGEAIPVSAALIQLYTPNRDLITTWALFKSLPEEYFNEGGSCVIIGTSPLPTRESSKNDLFEAGSLYLLTAEDVEVQARKKQRFEITDLTTQLQSFANAQLVDECLQSPNDVFLPYPQNKLKKIYVRKCYEDVFKLLLNYIEMESFAISGTPGIGKSLFFVYILYRLMKDFSIKALSLKPNRIVYHMGSGKTCFNLENQTAVEVEHLEAKKLVRQQDTLYIIDGQTTPMSSSCITLFISSPRSQQYKEFVKQKMAKEWYFPVWNTEELQSCQIQCYPNLSIEMLHERLRIYGGVARVVFFRDYSTEQTTMNSALADTDAVKGVKNIGIVTDIFSTTHTLLHIIVSTDGYYRFLHVNIASKYVGKQLWIRHHAQMITNLQQMFGGSPNEISRHLFEIYGHMVFSVGGRTLKCRCLEDATVTEITLDALNSQRITFGKDTIPTAAALTGTYFEPTDEDNFPVVDSLSPQGMFQFTVAAEHPIRGVSILRSLSKLYNEPKLYFVVPPHRFEKFQKQSFKGKTGTIEVGSIDDLKQYVLELPVI